MWAFVDGEEVWPPSTGIYNASTLMIILISKTMMPRYCNRFRLAMNASTGDMLKGRWNPYVIFLARMQAMLNGLSYTPCFP